MSGSAPSADIITVTPAGAPDTYAVEVRARSGTRHEVTATPAYLRELGLGGVAAARVVHAAFVFLLEREPNTSILPRFDLREIERYFPEFRREIPRRVGGGG